MSYDSEIGSARVAAAPERSPAEELFRSLGRPTVVEEPPKARLQRYIVEHGLRPGDRLPGEHHLAATLGGGRIVIRKALHALEALGLLESRAGSGWYLRAFDVSHASRTLAHSFAFHPSAVLDLLAVWRPAEAELALSLSERLEARDIDALARLAQRMRRRAARGEPFSAEDADFHRRMIAATGNLFALALVDLYWNVKQRLYESGFPRHRATDAPAIAQAHVLLVEALRTGDGERVSRLLREHHEDTDRRFAAWIAEHGDDPVVDTAGAVRAALLRPHTPEA